VLQTTDRQTTAYSERERELTFAKNRNHRNVVVGLRIRNRTRKFSHRTSRFWTFVYFDVLAVFSHLTLLKFKRLPILNRHAVRGYCGSHVQEWWDTQCQDTVSLATPSTPLHAWNQLEKVGFEFSNSRLWY